MLVIKFNNRWKESITPETLLNDKGEWPNRHYPCPPPKPAGWVAAATYSFAADAHVHPPGDVHQLGDLTLYRGTSPMIKIHPPRTPLGP